MSHSLPRPVRDSTPFLLLKQSSSIFAAFAVLTMAAAAQEAFPAATPAELAAMRKEGTAAALAEAAKGRFTFVLCVLREWPDGLTVDLISEFQQVLKRQGISWLEGPRCGNDSRDDRTRILNWAYSNAFDETMLKEMKRLLGDDVIERSIREAKVRHAAKQSGTGVISTEKRGSEER